MNILEKKQPDTQKLQIKNIFKSIGPGVITGAADDDPSGIATYTQTGAQYGISLLWTAVFMLPMMYVVQEMAARIGVVTGKGISKNIKLFYPKVVLYIIVSLLLIANIINLGADIGAMASAAKLIFDVNIYALMIFFTLIILILEIFLPYKKYAKVLKWLTISLFAYILTGLFIKNDWGQIITASLIPHIDFNFNFLFIVVGVLGTTISPYMMFWQANEEIEEEIKGKLISKKGGLPHINLKYIGKMRFDTFMGMLFSEVATWFIIVTSAGTLNRNGITDVQSASDAAKALVPLVQTFPFAGQIAELLFSVGIIGTGLLAVPIFAGSASYALCEVFGWEEGLDKKFKEARAFYIVILFSTLIGLFINFIGINPIKALVYTAVINGIISVPLILMLLFITNNKKIMGIYTNSKTTNVIGIITFVVMLFASFGAILSFFG